MAKPPTLPEAPAISPEAEARPDRTLVLFEAVADSKSTIAASAVRDGRPIRPEIASGFAAASNLCEEPPWEARLDLRRMK
jgi:hypothetical protein